MKVLVTGAAGFIGMHTVNHLIRLGHEVVGIDNLNDYYSVELKIARLRQCGILHHEPDRHVVFSISYHKNYRFIKLDLLHQELVLKLFAAEKFDYVVHLAAQAGVRYSIENPFAYTESNITGFLAILEGCRQNNVAHLVYASSSSVYGLNEESPFSESKPTEHPISLYAATKKANEMMAHSYSHLYQLPTTGLRFFTVYGPWGRPDMALFLFTEAIVNNKPISLFNEGNMYRDFTYVDDIVDAIAQCLFKPAQADADWSGVSPKSDRSSAPYRIFNVGSSQKVKLTEYIDAIEEALDKKAIRNYLPLQPGDVPSTYADTASLNSLTGYLPGTTIRQGVNQFINWYLEYYQQAEGNLTLAL